jgi:hypothetical protein
VDLYDAEPWIRAHVEPPAASRRCTSDRGRPFCAYRSPAAEAWLAVLPPYAELQRGEAAHTHEHLAHQVPDLRAAELCGELAARGIPETIQHDDLHGANSSPGGAT